MSEEISFSRAYGICKLEVRNVSRLSRSLAFLLVPIYIVHCPFVGRLIAPLLAWEEILRLEVQHPHQRLPGELQNRGGRTCQSFLSAERENIQKGMHEASNLRMLLGAPGPTTSNKKLLGAPGLTTRSKDASSDGLGRFCFFSPGLSVLSRALWNAVGPVGKTRESSRKKRGDE